VRYLRSLLVFLWMAITVIPLATLIILFAPLVSTDRLWWWFAQPYLRGAINAAKWVGGVKYRVWGELNLPDQTAGHRIILCPKHQSTWETFFFPSMMPQPLAYVFKRELLYIPFFGWALALLDMVHIDRSARSEAWAKVATLGERLMDNGKWIIMFPEGTRTPRGEKGIYKTGAARLAIATSASIIPIAVSSGRCWPRRTFSFIPGTIDVSIGPPMSAEADESPNDLMQRVEQWIETEMRAIDAEAYSDSVAIQASTQRVAPQAETIAEPSSGNGSKDPYTGENV